MTSLSPKTERRGPSGAFQVALLMTVLFALLLPAEASAKPTQEQAQAELPYLRMSLVMNSSYHLVQLPLHLQGKLKLTPSRAFVSFAGGLLYAGTAALAFTNNRTAQQVGIYTFMGVSAIGAGFVSYSLIKCQVEKQKGCMVNYFDALNVLILANQTLAWTLSIRQLTAARDPSVVTVPLNLSLLSGSF
jgi:hypothetical protein